MASTHDKDPIVPVAHEPPEQGTKASLERIAESVTDGRAENVRYRQEELFSLHTSLVDHASALCQALGGTRAGGGGGEEQRKHEEKEAEVEYYLALDAVRHFYDSLDFDKELEDEYRVANGKNHETRRVGFGMVVIRPTDHTRFYSIVVPLAAALSAGNCVVVELPQPNPGGENYEIDNLLRSLLTKSLDSNIFCLADNIARDLSKSDLESPFTLVVDQRGGEQQLDMDISERHLLTSPNDAIALVVVDRTADIDEAARLITQARTSFGGRSPYSPDLVLVNEFVKERFVEACSRFEGVELSVHDFKNRRSILANLKTDKHSNPLLIATCSSLVDVISILDPGTELLAGYFFAEPRAAKYLSQHLPCAVSYINQIPAHLLVGPAAPLTTASPDLFYRYSKEMFSRPRPQLIEPLLPEPFGLVDDYYVAQAASATAASSTLPPTEKVSPTKKRNHAIRKRSKNLRALATRPLRPVVRPDNQDVGFFEAGFLLAAGLAVLPVLGWGSFVLGRRLLSKY